MQSVVKCCEVVMLGLPVTGLEPLWVCACACAVCVPKEAVCSNASCVIWFGQCLYFTRGVCYSTGFGMGIFMVWQCVGDDRLACVGAQVSCMCVQSVWVLLDQHGTH